MCIKYWVVICKTSSTCGDEIYDMVFRVLTSFSDEGGGTYVFRNVDILPYEGVSKSFWTESITK
jgi:hypothetical protein